MAPLGDALSVLASTYVRQRPWTSIAVAAAFGCSLVFVRPWRSRWLLRAALGSAVVTHAKQVAARAVARQGRNVLLQLAERFVKNKAADERVANPSA